MLFIFSFSLALRGFVLIPKWPAKFGGLLWWTLDIFCLTSYFFFISILWTKMCQSCAPYPSFRTGLHLCLFAQFPNILFVCLFDCNVGAMTGTFHFPSVWACFLYPHICLSVAYLGPGAYSSVSMRRKPVSEAVQDLCETLWNKNLCLSFFIVITIQHRGLNRFRFSKLFRPIKAPWKQVWNPSSVCPVPRWGARVTLVWAFCSHLQRRIS